MKIALQVGFLVRKSHTTVFLPQFRFCNSFQKAEVILLAYLSGYALKVLQNDANQHNCNLVTIL